MTCCRRFRRCDGKGFSVYFMFADHLTIPKFFKPCKNCCFKKMVVDHSFCPYATFPKSNDGMLCSTGHATEPEGILGVAWLGLRRALHSEKEKEGESLGQILFWRAGSR